MKVLVLETDKVLAKNICNHLEIYGHKPDWQVDPQEAIISVDVEPVDLIIMDITLAGRSGIEFLYEFRSYPDWSNIPVIIFSNIPHREIEDCIAGFSQINIRNYFYKPTTPIKELIEAANALAPAKI